jgi:hypothetical protein
METYLDWLGERGLTILHTDTTSTLRTSKPKLMFKIFGAHHPKLAFLISAPFQNPNERALLVKITELLKLKGKEICLVHVNTIQEHEETPNSYTTLKEGLRALDPKAFLCFGKKFPSFDDLHPSFSTEISFECFLNKKTRGVLLDDLPTLVQSQFDIQSVEDILHQLLL